MGSPLQIAVSRVEEELRRTAEDGDLVLAVTDADTRILWTYGGRVMRRKAESVNFVAGGRWDDESVGTNALDLANRTARPSMVFSAEHYASIVHNWVCWAAPVNDPVTGRQLGVIDLSTTWDRTHPIGLATARVMARLIEQAMPRSHEHHGLSSVDESPDVAGLTLRLLGTAEAHLDGLRLLLNRRQTEILALLAMNPEGVSLERLHALVYGDQGVTLSTLKAEVSHLRSALHGQLSSRPYRLTMPVTTDVDTVLAAVRRGDVAAPWRRTAATCCPAPTRPPWPSWGSTSRLPSARRCSPTRSPRPSSATASSRRTTTRWSRSVSPASATFPTPPSRCSRAAWPSTPTDLALAGRGGRAATVTRPGESDACSFAGSRDGR